jgi:hypothetical protein
MAHFLSFFSMKQMQVPEEMVVQINYEDSDIPETVRELRPAVYRDGDSFCVLLGPDPQAGIFGCGDTTDQALRDWDQHFTEHMENHPQNDELVEYIEERRKTLK